MSNAEVANENGAVTLLLLAVGALVLVLAVAVADVGLVLATRLQAAAAADAAALAAAPVTFQPFGARAGPVAEAARFADANGARLVTCRCAVDRSWRSRRVLVVVARRVNLIGWGSVEVRAASRASFDPVKLITG